MELRVVGTEAALAAVGKIEPLYADLVFIYSLNDEQNPLYIGSTINPFARLLRHLDGSTVDTAPIISSMKERGHIPSMHILDITTKQDRFFLEAAWINKTPSARNTTRYVNHWRAWKSCPSCYRSSALGTLTETIVAPERLSKKRMELFELNVELLGMDDARKSDAQAWAVWLKRHANRSMN